MRVQTTIIIICLFISSILFASCPGMKGESAQRCHCHETAFGLPDEAFQCKKNKDCAAIAGNCADWAIVNLNYIKTKKVSFKNKLPSLQMPVKPLVQCKEGYCMRK